MGVVVRILLFLVSGWLMKAGLPEDVVADFIADPVTVASFHVGVETVVGAAVFVLTLGWRKLALKYGWSV